MAVPTRQADRTAIGRGISRTNSRSPAQNRSISRAVANEIGIVVRNPRRVARWLNIACVYRLNSDFLLEIADRDVERASGQQVSRSIVVTRLGELPARGSAREMRNGQASNKHDKG